MFFLVYSGFSFKFWFKKKKRKKVEGGGVFAGLRDEVENVFGL